MTGGLSWAWLIASGVARGLPWKVMNISRQE